MLFNMHYLLDEKNTNRTTVTDRHSHRYLQKKFIKEVYTLICFVKLAAPASFILKYS